MILIWLIAVPFVAGLLAWVFGSRYPLVTRWVALFALGVDLFLALWMWSVRAAGPLPVFTWPVEVRVPWIPSLGIGIHLGLDGLSLILVLLTVWMGVMAVVGSWTEITERVGFFHFNLLWTISAVLGVFTTLDLFLLAFFWEMMLLPTYFLIAIWGHENRLYAAVKFFIFTQASGLLLLVAIIGLAFVHYRATGVLTFEYRELLGTSMSHGVEVWLMLGFFVAFAVKLPAVLLHTWLPDAHTQAPTGGSVVLAGLLIKTGPYALLRFCVPLFPVASREFAPVGMILGAVGILYGGILAFAQSDLKRLVAYTSVSHMGFVLLGVYAWNVEAQQGVIITMVAHGLSTGGLFVLVGEMQERMHTRDLGRMGGLWSVAPRMGATGMVLAMASLGIPGLANFVGEVLILVGAYRRYLPAVALGVAGLIVSTIYAVSVMQRAFFGPNREGWRFPDLTGREVAILGLSIVALAWLGLYPHHATQAMAPFLHRLQQIMIHTGGVFPLE